MIEMKGAGFDYNKFNHFFATFDDEYKTPYNYVDILVREVTKGKRSVYYNAGDNVYEGPPTMILYMSDDDAIAALDVFLQERNINYAADKLDMLLAYLRKHNRDLNDMDTLSKVGLQQLYDTSIIKRDRRVRDPIAVADFDNYPLENRVPAFSRALVDRFIDEGRPHIRRIQSSNIQDLRAGLANEYDPNLR